MSTQSIKIKNVLDWIPILFNLLKKQFIICESKPEKLKEVGAYLKTEFKQYYSFITKVQLGDSLNIQLVLTHYLSLQFRLPSTSDLRFALLSEPKSITEYIVYGTKDTSIQLIKPMINKEATNFFEAYTDLIEMPSLIRKHYKEINTLISKYHLTTIPQDFEVTQSPTIFGFRPSLKEFIKRIEQLESQMFTTIKLKTVSPIKQLLKKKKTSQTQLIACVTTNADINPGVPDNWENNLISYMKRADLPSESSLPPLPPKGHRFRKPLPDIPQEFQSDDSIPPPLPPINPSRTSACVRNNDNKPNNCNTPSVQTGVSHMRDRSFSIGSVSRIDQVEKNYYDEPYEGDENYEDVYYGDSYYGDDGYYYVYNYDTKRYYVADPPPNDDYEEYADENIEGSPKLDENEYVENDAQVDNTLDIELEQQRLEEERLEEERLEEERLEKERLEKEKLDKEKLEQQRLKQQKLEEEKLEKEKMEKERLDKERLEQQRLKQQRLEQQKLEQEKLEQEKLEQEKLEQEKLEQEKLEQQVEEQKQDDNNDDEDDFSVSTFENSVVKEAPKQSIDDLCSNAQESRPSTTRRPKLIENQKKMRVETNEKDEKQNTFKLPPQSSSGGDSAPPRKSFAGMGMGTPMVTLADLQKKKQPMPSPRSPRGRQVPVKKDDNKNEKKSGLFGKFKTDKKDSKQNKTSPNQQNPPHRQVNSLPSQPVPPPKKIDTSHSLQTTNTIS
ncbi:Caldesmon [Entamoeba marina]